MDQTNLQAWIERNEIIDVFNRYAAGVDRRDRDLYRSCFRDEIGVQVGGGVSKTCPADEWVEQAFRALSVFQATQHLITNHVIELDGDRARGSAYLQALHFGPEKVLTVHGCYENDLIRSEDGWRICTLRLAIISSGSR
jgi:hypothetical protein